MTWFKLTNLRALAAVGLAAAVLGCSFDSAGPLPEGPAPAKVPIAATSAIGGTTAPSASSPAPAATRTEPASPSGRGVRRLPFSDAGRVDAINHTLDLIEKGGPFPYSQDGTVFQNRENKLPRQPRGHYHEYTVVTPRLHDRGPRRIVVGQKFESETYYTDDHYKSFVTIDPRRYP